MSKANPRKAVAAILPLAVECPCGATVRPMTLGMWAALERIGSPLVTGKEPKDALELVPSLYLLTHDPREVLRGSFFDDAVAWADTLPVSALEEIQRACHRQMGAMFDVLPEVKKKSRPETAGSRPSLDGRRGSADGAGMKSSGEPPAARSRSSAARTASRQARSSPSQR